MKLFCWLSLHIPDLAVAEAVSVLGGKPELFSNLVVLENADPARAQNLAFTRAVYEFWWCVPAKKLWEQIDSFDWESKIKGSFSINLHHSVYKNSDVANRVWRQLSLPKVSLRSPDTPISFFFVDNLVFCGKLLHVIKEDFASRTPMSQPKGHPASCPPRLARAFVNLLSAPPKSKIVDPFCGAGGILIESALMGYQSVGYDISKEMIKRAQANAEHMKVEVSLDCRDATALYAPEKFIVSDLPFGKLSGKKSDQDLIDLFSSFFERLESLLRVRAVIGAPSHIDVRKLVKQYNLEIVDEFDNYINRSISRKIFVIEPKK